jgi:hypothetical protein
MRSWPKRQDYTFPKRPEEPMCHQCDYDLANSFTISCCLAAHLSGLLAYRAAEARAGRGAALVRPCGMLDERCEPAPEYPCVLLAEIDLVFGAAYREPDRLGGGTPAEPLAPAELAG